MRRTIPLLLILCFLLTAAPVQAESFTIHSGVRFGMTVEQATALEAQNGFEIAQYPEWLQKMRTSWTMPYYLAPYEEAFVGRGTIAGVDRSMVLYLFNEDGLLYRAQYIIQKPITYPVPGVTPNPEISDIQPVLKHKYGEPADTFSQAYAEGRWDTEQAYAFEGKTYRYPITYIGYDETQPLPEGMYNKEVNCSPYDDGAPEHEGCYWVLPQPDGSTVVISYCFMDSYYMGGDSAHTYAEVVTYTCLELADEAPLPPEPVYNSQAMQDL